MSEQQDRQTTADIIRHVLIGEITVREALLKFPPDSEDESILAAYHALVHFEADEDLRRRDALYKEEQDDYLEFISNTLELGKSLPDNIIRNYDKFYKTAPIPHEKSAKGFWKSFLKFLNI